MEIIFRTGLKSQQGFHDDEPAGKFEDGVGIGAGNLFFFGGLNVSIIILPSSNSTLQRGVLQD